MSLKYNLHDTVNMMLCDDWKTRLKGEYWQLCIRLDNLRRAMHVMIHDDSKHDSVRFDMFREQFQSMLEYKHALERRADFENVDLDNIQISYW